MEIGRGFKLFRWWDRDEDEQAKNGSQEKDSVQTCLIRYGKGRAE